MSWHENTLWKLSGVLCGYIVCHANRWWDQHNSPISDFKYTSTFEIQHVMIIILLWDKMPIIIIFTMSIMGNIPSSDVTQIKHSSKLSTIFVSDKCCVAYLHIYLCSNIICQVQVVQLASNMGSVECLSAWKAYRQLPRGNEHNY